MERNNYPNLNECTIAIIGLGYVGLPLAVEFSKKKKCNISKKILERKVIGFDINQSRLDELEEKFDSTNEISREELSKVNFLDLTNNIQSISRADIFIVTVPTPINKFKKPDLTALKNASITVGRAIKIRSENKKNQSQQTLPIIIFESTVYPGTTEEICVPLIEKNAGFSFKNKEGENKFVFGYSPERINPGDKKRTLTNIVKVTSGNNINSSNWIKLLYGSIIDAGVYSAKSIKVAEAAKIIENTQRDLNIALMNELAIIFKLMNIDTSDVIETASTKWNFMPFKPGLVGGHCIGVDPYYLTYKAELLGYSPEIILAGRKINDGMGKWVAEQIILEMCRKKIPIKNSNILLLGITFKENCSDVRNTKVFDLLNTLRKYQKDIDIVDPLIDIEKLKHVYDITALNKIPENKKFNVVICAVAHKLFDDFEKKYWENLIKENGLFFDLKGIIPKDLEPIRI